MCRKLFDTMSLILVALLLSTVSAASQTGAQISIVLKANVSEGAKVQLAWAKMSPDAVGVYSIYRASLPSIYHASFPDSTMFSKIDSTTRNEYVDYPPASNLTYYLYYVSATTTSGVVLKSNLVLVAVWRPLRDVVRITSTPVETAEVGVPYLYQVQAVSSDSTARLHYFLGSKPFGMTIDSAGLIKWTPRVHGFAYVEVKVKSSKGGEATQRFTIKVASGSGIVQGMVTDTTGTKPIGRVVVRLYKVAVNTYFDYKAITDELGKYKIERVDPGTYYVHAEPMNTDYLPQWYDGAASLRDAKAVAVENNATTTVNFKLKPRFKPVFYAVKGSVVDSAYRAPVKGATVVFVHAGFGLNGSRGFASDPSQAEDFRSLFDFDLSADHRLDGTNAKFVFKTQTDAQGSYSLKLPQGSYIALAFAKGYVKIFYNQKTNLLSADTILVNSNLENINFNLPPLPQVVLGEINGAVIDSTTGQGVRARVIAFRERWYRPPLWNLPPHWFIPNHYVTDTDSTGKYSLTDLLPGDYIVLAVPVGNYAPAFYSSTGSTHRWRTATKIEVRGNVVAGIDIYVKPIVRSVLGYTYVSGRVGTSSTGRGLGKFSTAGVTGAIVYAVNGNGAVYGYDVTDENGSYAIAGVAPGSYSLYVDAPGYESSSTINALPTYSGTDSRTPQPASGVDFILLSVTSVDEDQPVLPADYVLKQNYPNPFNPTTNIVFSIPQTEKVTLTVYNLLGQKIATLVEGVLPAGVHRVSWSGRDAFGQQMPTGVYLYKLSGSQFSQVKRMVLLK